MMCNNTMSNYALPQMCQLSTRKVHSTILTFGYDAVHKSHGKPKEDEVVQMIHLQKKTLKMKGPISANVTMITICMSSSFGPHVNRGLGEDSVTHQFLECSMDGLFLPQVAVIECDLFTTEKKIHEDCPHLKTPDSFIMFI